MGDLMDTIINIILSEIATLLIILILILLLILYERLRKIVVVPSVSVATDKANYPHGETVTITGVVEENDEPQASADVDIFVKDPNGELVFEVKATTDADGKYTATYDLPSDAVGGTWTVTATALGTTATTTFTLSRS